MGDVDEEVTFKEIYDFAHELMTDNLFSHMIVLKSSHGYNLMSLDKIPLKLVHSINKKNNLIDNDFNDIAYFNRQFYVLRMGADKFVSFILWNFNNPIHIMSNAHRLFFNMTFNRNITKSKYFDDSKVFQTIKFKNRKHGWELIPDGKKD